MANKKGSHQLTWADRVRIDALIKAGHGVAKVAEIMHVHRSTIYNELKRGQYEHLNGHDWIWETRYSPDIAQEKAERNLKARGTQLKIGNDIKYANYIEDKIVNEGYSPDAVLGELKAQGREGEFKTRICTATLYSYIDKGIFLRLTNKNLVVKGKRKRKYRRVRVQARASAGESIEHRPEEIESRVEFGHWEMDSVIGTKRSKNTLLTITERKTRDEIVFKLGSHKAEEVVAALDSLEREWGDMFGKVFRSITVDNGTEFSDVEGMERSILREGKRTKIYYCHPYSSWERGTNEVTNRLLRRKVPKKQSFDDKTDDEIKDIEKWANNYPRRIHGYKTAAQMFSEELGRIFDKLA